MLDAEGLLKKHKAKGVFIDTNLLVLLLVGRVNIERVRNFKRTQNFTVEDFRLLQFNIWLNGLDNPSLQLACPESS